MEKNMTSILLSTFLAMGASIFGISDSASEGDLYARYSNSIYRVADITGPSGTGFAVEADSGSIYVVTNAHVCEAVMTTLVYMWSYGGDSNIGTIIDISEKQDLCLLSAPEDAVPLPVGDEVKFNDKLYTVGYPGTVKPKLSRGRLVFYEQFTVFDGAISPAECRDHEKYTVIEKEMDGGSVDICQMSVPTYSTTLDVSKGASGSPMFTVDHEVVGVINGYGGVSPYKRGYAVPLQPLKDYLSNF